MLSVHCLIPFTSTARKQALTFTFQIHERKKTFTQKLRRVTGLGEIFAHWAILFLGRFSENYKNSAHIFFSFHFPRKKVVH
jgi:hypothetical protein